MKKERGITLVSLIVTIIVIIILAGVTLYLFSKEGPIEHAKMSKFATDFREVEEAVKMYIAYQQIDKLSDEEEITKNLIISLGTKLTEEEKQVLKTEKIELVQKIKEISKKEIEEVDLYWINQEKIGINKKEKYLIDINSQQIYQYDGKNIYNMKWHTLDGGIEEKDDVKNDLPSTPVITSSYDIPTLTENGINLQGETIIEYDTRNNIDNIYSTDEGKTWNKYEGKFKAKTGEIIIAKSINKNTNEEVSNTAPIGMQTNGLGLNAYDGKDETYVNIKSGEKKIYVEDELWGLQIVTKIDAYVGTSSQNICEIRFYNLEGTILAKDTYTVDYGGNLSIEKKYTIPKNCSYITYWAGSNTSYYINIKEIRVLDEPTILSNEFVAPIIDNEGIKNGYYMATINYFPASVQYIYKLDDGEWKEYNNEKIKIELGHTIYAKGIKQNSQETNVGKYKAVTPSNILGPEAYDGKDETYINLKNGQIKIMVNESVWGSNILTKANAYVGTSSQNICEIRFYNSAGTILNKYVYKVDWGGNLSIEKKYTIPKNCSYITYWAGSNTSYYINIKEMQLIK